MKHTTSLIFFVFACFVHALSQQLTVCCKAISKDSHALRVCLYCTITLFCCPVQGSGPYVLNQTDHQIYLLRNTSVNLQPAVHHVKNTSTEWCVMSKNVSLLTEESTKNGNNLTIVGPVEYQCYRGGKRTLPFINKAARLYLTRILTKQVS